MVLGRIFDTDGSVRSIHRAVGLYVSRSATPEMLLREALVGRNPKCMSASKYPSISDGSSLSQILAWGPTFHSPQRPKIFPRPSRPPPLSVVL
jgi:hypothetical protein